MTPIVRLLSRPSPRGVYRIVLELPESQMAECAEWALQALRFSPGVQFRIEETTGRLIRERLYEHFRGQVR